MFPEGYRGGDGNANSVRVVRAGGGGATRWGQEGNNRSSGAGEEWRGGAARRPWGHEIKKGIHSTDDLQPQLIEMRIPSLILTSLFLLLVVPFYKGVKKREVVQ